MRFRLLRRRLTISAPRMAVRSALPWPVRWIFVAVLLGFCGAIALWAFEFGKDIAGLDSNAKEELQKLRAENLRLREDGSKAQSIANTAGSLLTAERAAQERLTSQIKLLEAENRALRDDLGFFEKLIPAAGGAAGITIRGLQAEAVGGAQLRWQVLVIQSDKNAPEFKGRLELVFSGTQNGKPWTLPLPGGPQPLQFRQYRRVEGLIALPAQTVVKNVSAKVVEGTATRSAQSIAINTAF